MVLMFPRSKGSVNAGRAVGGSMQQRLKRRSVEFEAAIPSMVDAQGNVTLGLLDRDLCGQFFKQLRDQRSEFLHLVPLLLWQNCYYLGCPVAMEPELLVLLKDRLGMAVKIVRISEASYRSWVRQRDMAGGQMQGSQHVDPLTGEIVQENITETAELRLAESDNQIDRLKAIISTALRNRASDIHLEPTPEGLRVRYRIDGILRHVTTLPVDVSRKVIVSLKVMCDMDIADSRRPQDGRIGENYMNSEQQQEGLDLRVSTLPCVSGNKGEMGEKAVLRLLRQQNSHGTIADVGFCDETRAIYEHWLSQPQGLVILTGPTGSGKTSTLYTSLQAIAKDSVNIVTVEDPVEYLLPGITQTPVNEAAGMTFAAGLRAILRQDPDVIMMGEVRDHETAETAVRAALTGHLVLTTLHTNDAIGAIPRLKDIGPDPGLISDALLGVVAQRLVRRVCPHCSEPHEPTAADLKVLGLERDQATPENWRKGKGCARCFHSGYLGREAVIELLNVDDRVRELIYNGTVPELQRYLAASGFASFRSAAIAKVTAGLTTVDEVKRVLPFSALSRR
jgi:type II secretory ATPase GspE/PulE/Tfp pilus assembly ATPase PilB-like protein